MAHVEAANRATEMMDLLGGDPQKLMKAHERVEDANALRDARESHLQAMTSKRA